MTFGKSQERGKPPPELYLSAPACALHADRCGHAQADPFLPYLLSKINLKSGAVLVQIAYTILYETALPMILLNEEWIKEAGLEIGESLTVRIEPKRLIITPDEKEVIP